MKKNQREDIYLIRKHSNLPEKDIEKAFKEFVYPDQKAWQRFLHWFLLILGLGFCVAGIIFFFAYNWNDLHKFVKIGILELIIVCTVLFLLLLNLKQTIRNILLTFAALLVGVLFAVYGQIYQTGADAYDFFLAWTIFISLWVFVTNFAPLWLLYLLLWNTTIILYSQQVASGWSEMSLYTILLLVNALFLILLSVLSVKLLKKSFPNWFLHVVAIVAISFATIGMIMGIVEPAQSGFPLLIFFVVLLFVLGIWHAMKTKSGFYLAIIPFSIVVMISALLMKLSDGGSMLFYVSVWIIAGVTFIISNLISLQKKWLHEK